MRVLRTIGMLVIASQITACAAMFHGTTEQISVHSNDPSANLYLNGSYIGKGHAITSVKKRKDYVITASKDGCNTSSVPLSKSFDGVTLLGILIDFGIISVLMVDGAATGAWQSFDQTNFVIDPACPNTAA